MDAGSLVFAPTFIPERNDPSGCQASVRGLGPGRLSDPVLLYAALVKGLAANLVALLPEQVRKNARGKPLAVSGGAVTHSPQLQAALASALHSGDLHVCHDADAATGAALLHLGQALDDPSSSSSSSSPSKPVVSLEEHVLKDEAKSSSARLPTRRKLATTKIA